MAIINNSINLDEVTYQQQFYKNIYGDNWSDKIYIDHYTDGFTDGILFEHKLDISSYGKARALGQAIIYLARFNRDGIPVPRYVWLVSQEEQKIYVFDMKNYKSYINDVEKYSNLKSSSDDNNFLTGKIGIEKEIIDYEFTANGMKIVLERLEQVPEYIKVDITEHNVYGWANYFYTNAVKYKQKPEKKIFFEELRKPTKTLKNYIEPWKGKETDFKYIMDILNDPMAQKKLGAFYTPPLYVKKATELVKEAINRVPKDNDYIILDRCAGTGNLEMFLDDDVLSHVIVSTYELKEWMVLKDRFGNRVRYIIPPIPHNSEELPKLNEDGFLSGANALTKDIIDNPKIRKYIDNPKCSIILFENPPYAETTSVEYQKRNKGTELSNWKNNFVVQEMKIEVKGTATNEMGNAFIWSAFKYFLRQSTDSYIVFSPVKYWKAQHLINKKFIKGFAFNRKHFHTNIDACIMCAYWSYEDTNKDLEICLEGYNIIDGKLKNVGKLPVKKINTLFSDTYYDKRLFYSDMKDGIIAELKGNESTKKGKQVRVTNLDNDGSKGEPQIIGYMVCNQSGFDNPDLNSVLTRVGMYGGNGFFLRADNFLTKLPMYAASRYISYNREWTERGRIMKSGDKQEEFEKDVKSNKIDNFLCKCLIWVGLTNSSHMRSIDGSNKRFYKNELCFDGDTTIATKTLKSFIDKGYILSEEEKKLFDTWKNILTAIKKTEEYNSKYCYGLYQIDEEINIKIQKRDNKGKFYYVYKYGDLNNLIKQMKELVKNYYLNNLVDTLFEYEFLK